MGAKVFGVGWGEGTIPPPAVLGHLGSGVLVSLFLFSLDYIRVTSF